MEILFSNLKQGVLITTFVFLIMMLTDYINVLTVGRLTTLIKESKFHQYLIASFLGVFPGCLGAFMVVSFYLRGMISFGALVGCMIATSGDEAFVMLSLFPKKAVTLYFILFSIGIISAIFIDKISKYLKLEKPCECGEDYLHQEDKSFVLDFKNVSVFLKKPSFDRFFLIFLLSIFLYEIIKGKFVESVWEKVSLLSLLFLSLFILLTVNKHYLEEHIWGHLIKKHLGRIFLWSFFAFLFTDLALRFLRPEDFISSNSIYMVLISALVGIIPQSGPHLVFVTMFHKGLIPFSVLLTSSIVQNGHALIPLLSHSIKAAVWVKIFNLAIGLIIGYFLFYVL
jgi:hypothetical protein